MILGNSRLYSLFFDEINHKNSRGILPDFFAHQSP